MDRPDYVFCIKDNSRSPKASYCGKSITGWVFQDLDHAFLTAKQKGRQMICGDCWRVIKETIKTGVWKVPPETAWRVLEKLRQSPEAVIMTAKNSDGFVKRAKIIDPDRQKRERKTCSIVGVQYLIDQDILIETNISGIYKLKEQK